MVADHSSTTTWFCGTFRRCFSRKIFRFCSLKFIQKKLPKIEQNGLKSNDGTKNGEFLKVSTIPITVLKKYRGTFAPLCCPTPSTIFTNLHPIILQERKSKTLILNIQNTKTSGVARNFKRGGGGIILTFLFKPSFFGTANLKQIEKQKKR